MPAQAVRRILVERLKMSEIVQDRGPVFDFDYMLDPLKAGDVHEGYWRVKEEAPPVFWTPANSGHWVINDAEAMSHALRHPEIFSSRYVTFPASDFSPMMIPLTLDPPDHRRYRQLLRPYFESRAIEPLEPWIVDRTNMLIDAFIEQGECEFVEAIASRLPISIFMEIMGLPPEGFDRFRTIVVTYFSACADVTERTRLADEINSINASLIADRRLNPKDDLISKLVHIDFEGRKLTDEELISIGFVLFTGGLDTVVNAITFGMRHLADDEALRQRIIDDPAQVPAIADELLRRYSIVQTRRLVVQDTEIGGVRMTAGDPVLVPLMMLGWDAGLNACPREVSIDRGACRHAAYGTGIHACLGIHLARLEMKIFYEVWFKRIGHFRRSDPGAALKMRSGNILAIEQLDLAWG